MHFDLERAVADGDLTYEEAMGLDAEVTAGDPGLPPAVRLAAMAQLPAALAQAIIAAEPLNPAARGTLDKPHIQPGGQIMNGFQPLSYDGIFQPQLEPHMEQAYRGAGQLVPMGATSLIAGGVTALATQAAMNGYAAAAPGQLVDVSVWGDIAKAMKDGLMSPVEVKRALNNGDRVGNDVVIGSWNTDPTWPHRNGWTFYRLSSGRIGTYTRYGVWKSWRPAKNIVLSKNPKVRDLLRADRQIDRMMRGLAKRSKRLKLQR